MYIPWSHLCLSLHAEESSGPVDKVIQTDVIVTQCVSRGIQVGSDFLMRAFLLDNKKVLYYTGLRSLTIKKLLPGDIVLADSLRL